MDWRSCVSLGHVDASVTRLPSSQAAAVASLEGVKWMGVSGGRAERAQSGDEKCPALIPSGLPPQKNVGEVRPKWGFNTLY